MRISDLENVAVGHLDADFYFTYRYAICDAIACHIGEEPSREWARAADSPRFDAVLHPVEAPVIDAIWPVMPVIARVTEPR